MELKFGVGVCDVDDERMEGVSVLFIPLADSAIYSIHAPDLSSSPTDRAQREVRTRQCWDFIPALGGHTVEFSANKPTSNKLPAQMWVPHMHGRGKFIPRLAWRRFIVTNAALLSLGPAAIDGAKIEALGCDIRHPIVFNRFPIVFQWCFPAVALLGSLVRPTG